MRHLLLAILLSTLPFCAHAQEEWKKQLDSLKTALATQKKPSTDAELLFAIGACYRASDPDSAVKYYNAANVIFETTKDIKGRFRYMASMTEIYANQAKSEKALEYCRKMIDLSNQVHDNHYLAGTYNNMGVIYSDMGEPEKALDYYQEAVKLYELEKDKNNKNLAYAYGNILGIYINLEQKEKAYGYALKAMQFSIAINDDMAIALTCANLSTLMLKFGKYDSALLLAKQELALGKKLNNKRFVINGLCNINNVFIRTRKFGDFLASADEIEKNAVETNDQEGRASANFYKALYYFDRSDFRKAKDFATTMLGIVDSNNIRTIMERDVHSLLFQTCLALGDMKGYYYHFAIADSLHEVYFSDKILKYAQQIQTEYELNKHLAEIRALSTDKELQKLKLNQQKTANIILICIVGGLVILAFAYYRSHAQKTRLLEAESLIKKQRIAELEKEKQLLAVSSILQGQEEERKRIANDLHDGLGSILSATRYAFQAAQEKISIAPENTAAFGRGMGMLDKSILELRRVAHNMMPEALIKYGLNTALQDLANSMNQNGKTVFTYQSYHIDDNRLPKHIAAQVYRIVQELTNNILKHAGANTALIQLILDNKTLCITVEDNGKGFDVISGTGDGMGSAIMRSRIAYLNGTIEIHSEKNVGTSITIEIPISS